MAPPGSSCRAGAGASTFGDPGRAAAAPRRRSACAAPHNLENAMGASAAALAVGCAGRGGGGRAARASPACRTGSRRSARSDGVLYVNDSKATNVASARRGIESFDGGVHAILGGSLKGGGFAGLREAVAARCRACYLIGEAPSGWPRTSTATVPLHRCGDLETRRARRRGGRAARRGGAALARLRQLRPVPRLRGARRALPGARAARHESAPRASKNGPDGQRALAARKRPVEYSILYTATLCLLAGGAVMVYSASSAESLLSGLGRRRPTTSSAT